MASRVCLVHYHEVGLKGKNRAHFERILIDSIKAACAAFSLASCTRISGHILVTFSVPGEAERAFDVIRRVPGVARVSLAFHTNRDPDEYCRAAILALREAGEFESFKVAAKRSNTDYALGSLELNAQVGEVLCGAFPQKRVQMHHPDVVVHVLVVQGSVYVYARSERGVGGLPVGSAGKVVTLLSSGIDSPVATWLLSRRGAVCVPVHFPGDRRQPIPASIFARTLSVRWPRRCRSGGSMWSRSAMPSAKYQSNAPGNFGSSCIAASCTRSLSVSRASKVLRRL